MHDRNISLHHVSAAALWVLGASLITIGLIASTPGLGHLGLMAAGMGGVLNIRGFICESMNREQNAFLLGQDSATMRRVR